MGCNRPLRRFGLRLSLACLLLACGCANLYLQPPTSAQFATLRLMKRETHLAYGGMQFYRAYENDGCRDSPQGGDLGFLAWLSSDAKPVRLIPGRRVFLQVVTSGRSGDQVVRCTNVLSFIPVAGQSYDISHAMYLHGCQAKLTLTGSEVTPDSYQEHWVIGACRDG